MSQPQTFIENNGLIYKLHESKEERLKRIKAEEDLVRENLHRFKKQVGEHHCIHLHENKVVLKSRDTHGTRIYDFGNYTTGYDDDYSTPEMKAIGKEDFRYQSSNHIIERVIKLIAEYYWENHIDKTK